MKVEIKSFGKLLKSATAFEKVSSESSANKRGVQGSTWLVLDFLYPYGLIEKIKHQHILT